jgi:hypothetical protein
VIEVTRGLNWLAWLLGVALVLALILMLTHLESSGRVIERFDQASVCEEPPAVAALTHEGIASLLDQATTIQPGCWQMVNLPVHQHAQAFEVGISTSHGYQESGFG